MKVRPISVALTDEQRAYFKSASDARYDLTIGKDYIVYAIYFVPDSVTDFTLYLVLDDVDRLLPVPACLFDVVDPRVSKYWQVVHDSERFWLALEPKEFIDDPYLSEAILDRAPEAWAVFAAVQSRLAAESLELD